MKKTISVILALSIVLSMTCCNKKTQQEEKQLKNIYEYGKQITRASAFSEGLGFVALDNNDKKVYCINKNGEVIFEITNKGKDVEFQTWHETRFINGLALFEENFYDKTGKKTSPEDVDATSFSAVALDGGYIIASTDDNTKVGVMDTNFNWTIKPDEKYLGILPIYYKYPNDRGTFLHNGFVYNSDNWWEIANVATGEIVRRSDEFSQEINQRWIEITEQENPRRFINGKTIVVNYDNNSFTVIDKQGKELFEHATNPSISIINPIQYNGNEIMISNWSYGRAYYASGYEFCIYDMNNGNLISQIKLKDVEKLDEEEILDFYQLGDGTITINTHIQKPEGSKEAKAYIYDVNFNKLF